VLHDGERGITVRFVKGDRVKDFPITFPVEIYRGVYVDGKTYERGDGVTWGGSEWGCNEATNAKPGDGSKAWTLKVKRGRDGKDGQDAPSLAVVKVGGR
jgi:integrin beta 3